MSPFDPQDQHMETIIAPKNDDMGCSSPPNDNDNVAADSTDVSQTKATPTPNGSIDTPAEQSKTKDNNDNCPPSTTIQVAAKPQLPQTTCSSATVTGLISPLSTMKQNSTQKNNNNNSKSSSLRNLLPTKSNNRLQQRHAEYSIPTTPQVDSYAISKIEHARTKIKQSFMKSKLLDNGDEYVFPRFDMQELTLGKVLGRGGFGTVLEIKAINVATDEGDGKNNDKDANLLLAGKSSVFKIDEFENTKHTNNRRRKKSHSFRGFRRHHFDLKLNNSHDGCEGLSRISERDTSASVSEGHNIRLIKSHDCIEDGDDHSGGATMKGGGKQHHLVPKRELRSKALSWTHAKAKAAHDVSNFFHRKSPTHHDDGEDKGTGNEHVVEQGEKHGEEEKSAEVVNEEKKDQDVDNNEKITPRPREVRKKSVSYDSKLNKCSSDIGDTRAFSDRPTKIVSRNFSFLAWRDSEAGEEGNDAISPEELKKYNIDTNLQFAVGVSMHSDENGDGEKKEVNPDDPSGAKLSSSGLRNEFIIEAGDTKRGRRLVLFSAPESEVSSDNGEEGRTNAPHQHDKYQDKTYITENATTNAGEARYVIKIISPQIVENEFKKFLQAAMDMATETYFLSVISHPNILKMRAVGQGDMFSPSYFLVLDRLYGTLSDKIETTWKTQLDQLENSIIVWNRAHKLNLLWEERMGVMRDLAGALAYLHDLNIIYRDIKPENVGFDSHGNVKLFDFGLTKEVHEEDVCANGTYKLTPNTGSIRYMAPENGNKWPYNFLADSYSFGIMLWEVISLERPFANYSPKEIRDMAMRWGERPKIREEWPENVVELMKSAWDSNFKKRPTMKVIRAKLEEEIEASMARC